MNTDFHEDEVNYLLQEFTKKDSFILPCEKTDEESKNYSDKSDCKPDAYSSPFNFNIFDSYQNQLAKKSNFLLSIIEVGNSPTNYFKRFPYPNKKYFWYQILQRIPNTKKAFQYYLEKNITLTPSKIKEIYVKIENLNNISSVFDIIKSLKYDIDDSSLK